MISGPTLPNTHPSLLDLVVRSSGLVEHGMQVVDQDLVLGRDTRVDVLACDAAGAPVLVFLAAPETHAGLAANVLGARTWLAQNSQWFAREVGIPGVSHHEPRLFVVGVEILADTLEELRAMADERLRVLQFTSFSVGGRLRVGVTELLGGAGLVELDAPGQEVSFAPPAGIADPQSRALCERFLDLCRRIDPGIVALCDRFHSRVALRGRLLAEVGLEGGRILLSGPGFGDRFELRDDNCLEAVDRVLRTALAFEAEGVPEARPPRLPRERPVAEPHRSRPLADRYSLEPIRRSVARAQLSRDELSALEGGTNP